jgi:hypothetical protein
MQRANFAGPPQPSRLGATLLLAAGLVAATPTTANATWAVWYPRLAPEARKPPDQSWMQDVPASPGTRPRGKVAVFVFKGDDVYEPIRAAVVRALRRRGLNVTASLRPVDSAAQYREMSYALELALFVEGELTGQGRRQTAHIRLRSGLTGQPVATATFTGPTHKIVGDVDRSLWTRIGPTVVRACSKAAKPRRPENEPLRIEAGTADGLASQGT